MWRVTCWRYRVKKQKFSKGDLVRVVEYYNDMIAKSTYVGIVTDIKRHEIDTPNMPRTTYFTYKVLDMDDNEVKTAEDFAIDLLGGES